MSPVILSLAAIWLICGLAGLNWFHRWHPTTGRCYQKQWHITVDYITVLLLGPISLLIMCYRDGWLVGGRR